MRGVDHWCREEIESWQGAKKRAESSFISSFLSLFHLFIFSNHLWPWVKVADLYCTCTVELLLGAVCVCVLYKLAIEESSFHIYLSLSSPLSISPSLHLFISFYLCLHSADRAVVPRWLRPLLPHADQLHVRPGQKRDNWDVRLHCLRMAEG